MIIVSEIIASFIRIILCLFFIEREKTAVKNLIISVIGAVASCLIIDYGNLPFLFSSVFEILVLLLCLKLADNSDRRKELFFCIMYEIAVALWTFIFGAVLAVLSGISVFTDRTALPSQLPLLVVVIILVIAAVLIYKGGDISFRTLSLLSVISMFGTVIFSEKAASEDIAFTYLVLSMVLLTGIMIFRLNRQYETEKELAELKERQADLLERDYNVLNKAYSENARTFHDMHNHIGAVRSLLTAEKYDKAIEYLDNLQKPVSSIASNVWTGDETVDYLINSRVAAAESEGISFETQIEFPKGTNIGGADLCAVLGNLLDNAFEAVRRDKDTENRSITLIIRRINHMLVIKIANTFNGEINITGGKLRTTKTNGGLHGWGVESARTAAAKYDGTITTTAENGIFTAVATLSF